jgi:hypothetical protein
VLWEGMGRHGEGGLRLLDNGVNWDWDRDDVISSGRGDDHHDFGVILRGVRLGNWVSLASGPLFSQASWLTMFLFLIFPGFCGGDSRTIR